jgi:hypothetical protein
VAFLAALGVVLVWGVVVTVAEARWDKNKLLDHPGVLPAEKEQALGHLRRSYVYQGARIIGGGVVAGAGVAVGTGSAALALAVGAAAELLIAAQYLLKHQRRGPRE